MCDGAVSLERIFHTAIAQNVTSGVFFFNLDDFEILSFWLILFLIFVMKENESLD